MNKQEYKDYCLHKYIAELEKEQRDKFFALFDKIHGAKKLDELKQKARKVYLELNKCA
jgi:hypothetical protein